MPPEGTMFSLKQMLDNGHRVQILYTFFVTDEARVRSMFFFCLV